MFASITRQSSRKSFTASSALHRRISTDNRLCLQSLSAFISHQSKNGLHRYHLNMHTSASSVLSAPSITLRKNSSSAPHLKAASSSPSAQHHHPRSKSAKRRLRKQINNKNARSQLKVTIPTTAPTGRPIMTEQVYQSDECLTSMSFDMTSNNPKSLLNNKVKPMIQYNQHLAFDTVGPPGNQLFLATTTTVFEGRYQREELICSGMGRTKKQAEFYAAIDLIKALKEVKIDARNPPNLKNQRKKRDDEQFQERVAKAQMILELLGSSRPKFTFEEALGGWQASVGLWVRGEFFSAEGLVATKKSKAEGNALLELVFGKKELIDTVNADEGEDVFRQYMNLIDSSPGKHIAGLRVPPLPNEIAWNMMEAIGTHNGRHEERMKEHESIKAEYEEKQSGRAPFRPRRQRRYGVDYDRINESLRKEEEDKARRILDEPGGKRAQMEELREALPITAIRQELLDALKTDQVVVVSGGTGSGKSTQCPQYILEEALLSSNGAQTEIIVTQPRKIAAVSVAERVADERHEKIGHSIGYTVRFHKKPPREAGGTIEFVTTGVLLNRIMNDPMLEGVSHVVIDEVHERDINTDFLLILLREMLPKRPDLRVILMSATLNADTFASYFGNVNTAGECKHLSVPTQPRHPVDVFYLEDMLSMDYDIKDLARSLLHYHDDKLRSDLEEAESEVSAALQLESRAHDEDEGMLYDSDSDSDEEGGDYVSSLSTAQRLKTLRRAVSMRRKQGSQIIDSKYQQAPDHREAGDSIVKLVSKLALHLSATEIASGRKGSILCFLPGWDEIKAATAQVEEEVSVQLRNKIEILPLHSTIPQDDQQKVFIPAKEGTVKVILSTNIAESSVTIDDVLAVVDGGLVRELQYDAESAMSMMETVPISRASATQRLGRAGRVAPGKCFRLYSAGAFEAMPERPTPEIQRTALEATCLQTSTVAKEGIEHFLELAMDPPPSDSVSFAVDRLAKIGALKIEPGKSEILTPLGRALSRLPLDPATGRMLIMGVVMKCLNPVLTAAACFSSRSVFYNPPGLRDEAQEIRRSFSSSSDTTAQIRAFNTFWTIANDESFQDACDWAKENYVSIVAMLSIKAIRSQLLTELKKIGLIDSSDLEKVGYKEFNLRSDSEVNVNAKNEMLHNAVLASSIPGNISSRRQLGHFGTLRTRVEGHAEIHPSSVSFFRKPPRGVNLPSWYLYREMVLSSQVFLRECSSMEPEQLLLFGGYTMDTHISDSMRPMHVIDDWIVAESSCEDTLRILTTARKDINAALEYKVMHPRHPLSFEQQDIIDNICDMFDRMNVDSNNEADFDDYF